LIERQKIHLIYNGIDVNNFSSVVPQRFGFGPDDIIIGRVSRLTGGKNIPLLIQAVAEIRKDPKYRHVRLVICGGDTTQPNSIPRLANLKRQAEPLGESVIFTGEVHDPTAIICGFDIATCTSKADNEGIPNSLIEAMAAAKPVVSTQVGDIAELVDDGRSGILVPDDDVKALVVALKKMIDDPGLRRQYGLAGQARVRQDFNLETQVAKYAALYESLFEQKGYWSLKRFWPIRRAV
jgi:glycosyltransferase involved in cell wall biosynthesis